MTILKGFPYSFVVKVLQVNSDTPQSLASLSVATSQFRLVNYVTDIAVPTGSVSIEIIDSVKGILKITLSDILTATLEAAVGDKVDNYYPKPTYKGVLYLNFTDTTPDRAVLIDSIRVTSIGD